MSQKLTPENWLIFLLVVLVTGSVIIYALSFFTDNLPSDAYNIIDHPGDGPEPGYDLDDTTRKTYREFKAIEQERENMRKWKENRNRGSGNSFEWHFIGFKKIGECDTCTSLLTVSRQVKGPAKYYLVLPGYRWKDPDTEFYVDNGKNYLRYVVWDKDRTATDGNRSGHYATKELPFRFSNNISNQPVDKSTGAVLIPISKKNYNLLRIPGFFLLIAGALFVFYNCFAIPARVLIRISRGEIFTRENVRPLNRAAWILIGLPFAVILLQCILRLVFYGTITNDVSLSIPDILHNFRSSLFAGIIFLAIAKAFKRGLRLQKEQDLTI